MQNTVETIYTNQKKIYGKESNSLKKWKETYERWQARIPVRIAPALFCILTYTVLRYMPKPEGLTEDGWRFFAFFCSSILAIILKTLPIGAMSLLIIALSMVTKIASPTAAKAAKDGLMSMNNTLIWLIVISVIVSQGLLKTGLGARLGYFFIAVLGKKTLGIGYGLALCEVMLAPFTPSNTARGGGIIHPIMRSIAHAYDSDPESKSEGKIGTYLALVNYHANPISSAMFITATAPNPLVVQYIAEATNMEISLSWSAWALCMLLPGLVAMFTMPLIIYMISPPEIKSTPNAVDFAKESLAKLGKIKFSEICMLVSFLLMLVFWSGLPAALFGKAFALNATAVAFLGLSFLLLTGVLTWEDALKQKSAWDTLIWFGALVMMANQLNAMGVVHWFSDSLRVFIENRGIGWPLAMAVLVLPFMYAHYFFASTTAHISAMMLAFLTVGVQLVPHEYCGLFVLLMASASTIMMGLTHYATGTSPIIFGSNFVSLGRWWRVGFIMSIVNLIIFALIGSIWWKILGYW